MPRADGKRPPKRRVTDEWLRENFSYDAESGVVSRAGRRVGNPDSKGYLRTQVLGNFIRIHRLAWFLGTGKWPGNQIDHIDGDKTNNRLANLRDVDVTTNIQNRRHATGVRRSGRRFGAAIGVDGRTKWLGTFDTKPQARAAYESARAQLHAGYAG